MELLAVNPFFDLSMVDVKAKLNYYHGSPIKLRRVAKLIKRRPVMEALVQLKAQPGKGASVFRKLLDSAVANAEHNFELNKHSLYVKEIRVDKGPVLKRYLPRARGRADILRKPTAHLTIVLGETQNNGMQKSKIN